MYCKVTSETEVEVFTSRPERYVDEMTSTFFGEAATNEEMAEYGIYPFEFSNTVANDPYHTSTTITYDIQRDRVVGTYIATEISLAEAQAIRTEYINEQWTNAVNSGAFECATVPGFVVDCRRSTTDNDIQNISGIIDLVAAGIVPEPVPWRGVNATEALTATQLQTLKLEMLGYGAATYQRKFIANFAIAAATTVAEVCQVEF